MHTMMDLYPIRHLNDYHKNSIILLSLRDLIEQKHILKIYFYLFASFARCRGRVSIYLEPSKFQIYYQIGQILRKKIINISFLF